MQLSVVMRPLPHSFSLGHNKSATPAFGFSASPAVGSWRKLGGSAPSPLKCPSLWIREQELPSEGAVKRTQLLPAPAPLPHLPHHPVKPGSPLGHRIAVLWRYATGLGSHGPGAHNCIWFVKLGGYINIVSPLITSGSPVPPSRTQNQSIG